jgi:hypothetical protein
MRFKMTQLLGLSIGLVLATPAFAAATANVEAEGQAMIKNGDEPAARDRALEDAQRKAVESAVGTMISAETVMENYQIISDRILAKSAGYIKNYTITSSGPDNGIYKVVIKALVATGNLSGDVDAISSLLKRKGMPRVFVVVPEVVLGSTAMTTGQSGTLNMQSAESGLIASLRNAGFLIVDPDVLSGKLSISQIYRKGDVPDGVAKKIGSLSGAEVVIYGRAAVQVSNLSVLKSKVARASANVRAVNVQTGEIIAMSSVNHPKKAPAAYHDAVGPILLKKVGEAAAADLIKQIVKKWQKDTSGATRIVLTVKGLKFRSAKQLKSAMSGMRGVASVNRRSLKRGVAVFDVNVKAGVENFANSLDGLKVGKRKKIEITGVDGETINASLGR